MTIQYFHVDFQAMKYFHDVTIFGYWIRAFQANIFTIAFLMNKMIHELPVFSCHFFNQWNNSWPSSVFLSIFKQWNTFMMLHYLITEYGLFKQTFPLSLFLISKMIHELPVFSCRFFKQWNIFMTRCNSFVSLLFFLFLFLSNEILSRLYRIFSCRTSSNEIIHDLPVFSCCFIKQMKVSLHFAIFKQQNIVSICHDAFSSNEIIHDLLIFSCRFSKQWNTFLTLLSYFFYFMSLFYNFMSLYMR